MRGKLIVIEGTDCSGKETQSNLLIEKLRNNQIEVEKFCYPNYDSPTGKIVGGPYLGKKYITDCWFEEGAVKVDPKVASLYYAADRRYNFYKITWLLENGINVILDRYVYSNMAHQGCKIDNIDSRHEMYKWLDDLEFKLLELPKPDIAVFLHMPTEYSKLLKECREEGKDEHEKNENYLNLAEQSYLELSSIYNFKIIECVADDSIKEIEDINQELFNYIFSNLNNN